VNRLGIVGSGQLAEMLAQAAKALGLELHLQASSADDPANAIAAGFVLGDPEDGEATAELARSCARIGFENEWVDLAALQRLENQGVQFQPAAAVLADLVDKRRQRHLLERLNLPSPRWCDLASVVAAGGMLPPHLELPLMAKAACGGYDGRGTERLANRAALEALLSRVDHRQWILEELVPFECELALLVARSTSGVVCTFPLVETHQQHQVCDWVLAPAAVSHAVEARARSIAASIVTALNYVGVLAVEFFLSPQGLLVNELAPRTHNSAHFSIEACETSQFTQQLNLLADRPMGSSELLVPGALMVNLLGHDLVASNHQQQLAQLAELPHAHLHWYGKTEFRPGRKLGHVTLLLQNHDPLLRRREAMDRLAEVRRIWPVADGRP
jgi:5-(carboxyamino)imidazole ribonucleotide synthase